MAYVDEDDCPTLVAPDEIPSLVEDSSTPSGSACDKPPRVPVTIITGFLGAGKTTFLNFILNQHHGKRIAIIQNEFGMETGSEQAMVVGSEGERDLEWMELPNGCICCSVRDDFVLAIENLVRKKRDRFDFVFVETDGLADPGPVASVFWTDEQIESEIYLDGIIAIVDSKHILLHLHENYHSKGETESGERHKTEAERQLAFADRIIINKSDLITDQSEREMLERTVRGVNGIAPLVWTERCNLSDSQLQQLLDMRAVDASDSTAQQEAAKEAAKGSACDSGCAKDHKHHVSEVRTVYLEQDGDVDYEKIVRWLGDMVWLSSEEAKSAAMELFRYKGVLSLRDKSCKYSLQGVHQLFDIQPTRSLWPEAQPRTNKLVFIGKNLDEEMIKRTFVEKVLT